MARSARFLAALALVAVFTGVVGCSPEATPTTPSTPAPAEAPEAALVEQRCTMCHSTERVYSKDYDAATWTATIDRMVQNGLVIADDEKQAIIDYLAGRTAK